MSFTPGPWQVGGLTGDFRNERGIVSEHVEIGVAYPIEDEFGAGPEPEREANARLIAAAPELLEALKTLTTAVIRDDNPRDEGHFSESEEMKAAHAAIAKAEGRS